MKIPDEAIEAAKTAMETVTPPPGVDRSAWLKEHGRWALLAGAIAAAAPHVIAHALREASDAYPLETAHGAEHAVLWLKDRADQLEQTP